VQNAQNPDLLRFDPIKNKVSAVAWNNPQVDAYLFLTAWVPQDHSFIRGRSELYALLDNGCSDARRRGRVLGGNVVLDLVKVLLGQPCEKTFSFFIAATGVGGDLWRESGDADPLGPRE
jgi:hypothetical protein